MFKFNRKKSKLLTTAKVIGFAGILSLASPIKVNAAVITDEEAQEILEKIENDTCTDEEFLKLLDWMQEEHESIKQETQELKEDMMEFDKKFTEDLNSLETDLENVSFELDTTADKIRNETDELCSEIEKLSKDIKRELVITQLVLGAIGTIALGGLVYSTRKIMKSDEKKDAKVLKKTYE